MSINPIYDEAYRQNTGNNYNAGDWQNIPEIVHSDTEVKGFFGEYRFLSNFGGNTSVTLDGVEFDSTEKAYQAAKWRTEDRSVFINLTNKQAMEYNHQHDPNGYSPKGWDAIKLDVMRFLLEQKFNPEINPENYQKILATGEKYLEETNWWNDTFWGKNLKGQGENNLGKLLMEIRDNLKKSSNYSL